MAHNSNMDINGERQERPSLQDILGHFEAGEDIGNMEDGSVDGAMEGGNNNRHDDGRDSVASISFGIQDSLNLNQHATRTTHNNYGNNNQDINHRRSSNNVRNARHRRDSTNSSLTSTTSIDSRLLQFLVGGQNGLDHRRDSSFDSFSNLGDRIFGPRDSISLVKNSSRNSGKNGKNDDIDHQQLEVHGSSFSSTNATGELSIGEFGDIGDFGDNFNVPNFYGVARATSDYRRIDSIDLAHEQQQHQEQHGAYHRGSISSVASLGLSDIGGGVGFPGMHDSVDIAHQQTRQRRRSQHRMLFRDDSLASMETDDASDLSDLAGFGTMPGWHDSVDLNHVRVANGGGNRANHAGRRSSTDSFESYGYDMNDSVDLTRLRLEHIIFKNGVHCDSDTSNSNHHANDGNSELNDGAKIMNWPSDMRRGSMDRPTALSAVAAAAAVGAAARRSRRATIERERPLQMPVGRTMERRCSNEGEQSNIANNGGIPAFIVIGSVGGVSPTAIGGVTPVGRRGSGKGGMGGMVGMGGSRRGSLLRANLTRRLSNLAMVEEAPVEDLEEQHQLLPLQKQVPLNDVQCNHGKEGKDDKSSQGGK